MLGDASKLGALGKILNDNVALQSFNASILLATAIAFADVLQTNVQGSIYHNDT